MRQLVQLDESAARFEELGVEVIAVFREEQEGVAGLEKIRNEPKPRSRCVLIWVPKILLGTARERKSLTTTLSIHQGPS